MPKGSQTKEGQEIISHLKKLGLAGKDLEELQQSLDNTFPPSFRNAYAFFQKELQGKDSIPNLDAKFQSLLNILQGRNESVQGVIESSLSPAEIVHSLTERVQNFEGVPIDLDYWERNFGMGSFEDSLQEFDIDLRKVKKAIDAVNKQGMRIVGGSPQQELASKGSVFVVNVDGNRKEIPFNEQPKFNAHVAFFAMDNGDPTRHLKE